MGRLWACTVVVLALTAAGARAAPTACTPGVRTVDGIRVRVFCGPAKATVHAGGKTLTFTQGECQRTSTYLVVNIGVVSLEPPKIGKLTYFGLLVGRAPGMPSSTPPAAKDGPYKGGTLAVTSKGTRLAALTPTVTLKGGRRAGSFSGQTFDRKQLTGSFSCG